MILKVKFCEKCGKLNSDDRDNCEVCGAPLLTVKMKKVNELPNEVSFFLADGVKRIKKKSESIRVHKVMDNSSRDPRFEKNLAHTSYVPIPYTPSGKWTFTSFFLMLLTTAIAATASGILYALICYVMPVKILNLIPFALLMYFMTRAISYISEYIHIRSPNIMAFVCLLASGYGYFAHWAFWCALYTEANVFSYFWNFSEVVRIMDLAADTDHFRLLIGKNYGGFFLKLVWFVEFVIYMCIISCCSREIGKSPFAEDSKTIYMWDRGYGAVVAAPSDPEYLHYLCNEFRAGNFDYFLTAELILGKSDVDRFNIEFSSATGSSGIIVKVELKFNDLQQKLGKIVEVEARIKIVEGIVPDDYIQPIIDLIDERKKGIDLEMD